MTVAVVIPVLNEVLHLPIVLASLRAQTSPAERVIVVDAGSRDDTVEAAREAGAELLEGCEKGRGNQISAGVAVATEDVILIAHADMRFRTTSLATIREYLSANPACAGGCLGHRFDSPRWIFRVIEWFDCRRARRGMSYGDQAQFFRRERLIESGGFPAQPLMEDVELSRRLLTVGEVAYLECPVEVSPRGFERLGVVRTVLRNRRLRAAYRRGGVAACRELYQDYYASG